MNLYITSIPITKILLAFSLKHQLVKIFLKIFFLIDTYLTNISGKFLAFER